MNYKSANIMTRTRISVPSFQYRTLMAWLNYFCLESF